MAKKKKKSNEAEQSLIRAHNRFLRRLGNNAKRAFKQAFSDHRDNIAAMMGGESENSGIHDFILWQMIEQHEIEEEARRQAKAGIEKAIDEIKKELEKGGE